MSTSQYRVTQPQAAIQAADPLIEALANSILHEVQAATPKGPTGDLATAWTVTRGHAPAVRIISNPEPYAAYVEYGTRYMHAEPYLGPVIAKYRAAGGGA